MACQAPRSRQSLRSRDINSSPIDQEQIVASSSSSTTMSDSFLLAEDVADTQLENIGGVKKPAWNKSSNEAIAEVVVGAVMGADSWPALSESARASPKSSSTTSLKALSQEMTIVSLSSPKDVTSGISTSNSNGNHVILSRQRSMKRGGGSSSLSQAPPTQTEAPPPTLGKSGGLVGESSRDNNTYRDASQRTSSFRRNNSGRGDGGRRDQERGKQDWNNSHARRSGSRPFIRAPATNAPFIPPPPPSAAVVRPFVTPMVYTEMPSPVFYVHGPHPDSLRPMPVVPISSMFFPMPNPYLHSKLVNQIDYYFSNENLVKDTFLRKNMDGEGWVLIKLIAGFKKVMELTDNIQLILHAVQASNVVEVKGDKVRRKNDWFKWIMPPVESTVTSQAAT